MWNYRVVKHKEKETEEEYLEVCEVYYDTLGKPMGHCNATVGGETIGELETVLQMMSQALQKTVMNSKDFK